MSKSLPNFPIDFSHLSKIAPKEIDFQFFEEYPGYLTTLHGPRASDEELSNIADKIRSIPW